MHGGSNSRSYIDFIKAAKEDGIKAPFYYALAEGDWFFYKEGKVKNLNKLKLVTKEKRIGNKFERISKQKKASAKRY